MTKTSNLFLFREQRPRTPKDSKRPKTLHCPSTHSHLPLTNHASSLHTFPSTPYQPRIIPPRIFPSTHHLSIHTTSRPGPMKFFWHSSMVYLRVMRSSSFTVYFFGSMAMPPCWIYPRNRPVSNGARYWAQDTESPYYDRTKLLWTIMRIPIHSTRTHAFLCVYQAPFLSTSNHHVIHIHIHTHIYICLCHNADTRLEV